MLRDNECDQLRTTKHREGFGPSYLFLCLNFAFPPSKLSPHYSTTHPISLGLYTDTHFPSHNPYKPHAPCFTLHLTMDVPTALALGRRGSTASSAPSIISTVATEAGGVAPRAFPPSVASTPMSLPMTAASVGSVPAHRAVKIAYHIENASGGGLVVKDLTLKIAAHHTAAKAIDKVVKALSERYPSSSYSTRHASEHCLLIEGDEHSRLSFDDPTCILNHPSAQRCSRFLMVRSNDPLYRSYTAQRETVPTISHMPQQRLMGFAVDMSGYWCFPPGKGSIGCETDAIISPGVVQIEVGCQTDAAPVDAQQRDLVDSALNPVMLAAELRIHKERTRSVQTLPRRADNALQDTLSLGAEYPRPSSFHPSQVAATVPGLLGGVQALGDPVLTRLAAAVDEERAVMCDSVATLQRECQELRHGWLSEASKVERLAEAVSLLAADRETMFSHQAVQGRSDAEFLSRSLRRKVQTHLEMQYLATTVLSNRLRYYKSLHDIDSEADEFIEGSDLSPIVTRDALQGVMDEHLVVKIGELERENEALASRVALLETRSATLSGGGLSLSAADEAKVLTEKVVQLEGDLARERDLRMQYAVEGEVTKQISISEILRQKEHITLQQTYLAHAGVEFHESPLRHVSR